MSLKKEYKEISEKRFRRLDNMKIYIGKWLDQKDKEYMLKSDLKEIKRKKVELIELFVRSFPKGLSFEKSEFACLLDREIVLEWITEMELEINKR